MSTPTRDGCLTTLLGLPTPEALAEPRTATLDKENPADLAEPAGDELAEAAAATVEDLVDLRGLSLASSEVFFFLGGVPLSRLGLRALLLLLFPRPLPPLPPLPPLRLGGIVVDD